MSHYIIPRRVDWSVDPDGGGGGADPVGGLMGAPLYVTFGVNVKPVKSRFGGPVTGPRVTAPVGDLLTGVGVTVIVPVGVVTVGGF